MSDEAVSEKEKADVYRIKGEILTAYLHQMKKGDMEVTLNNFYDDENPITIALNPALTPSQNAQKYFSKYQKLTTAVAYVNEQVEHTHAENEYLESIETLIQLSDPQDLEDIKDELRESGYLKKKYKGKQKKHKTSKPHKFLSWDGTTILIGKNNVQNDKTYPVLMSSSKAITLPRRRSLKRRVWPLIIPSSRILRMSLSTTLRSRTSANQTARNPASSSTKGKQPFM